MPYETENCPCLSGKLYPHCCQPLHQGEKLAETAEQLMRSRYSAFCLGNSNYLLATLHPSQRQPDDRQQLEETMTSTNWLGLRIIDHRLIEGNTAEVEFVAFYHEQQPGQLHERSHFVYEHGQWFYLDGEFLPPIKLGRNESCFCGSGKKLKRCHS